MTRYAFFGACALSVTVALAQTANVEYVAAGPQTVSPSGQLNVRVRITNTGSGTWSPVSTFECPTLDLLNNARCLNYPLQFGSYGLQFLVYPRANGQPDFSTWWVGHANTATEVQPAQTTEVARSLSVTNLPAGDYVLLSYMVRNWLYAFGPNGALANPQQTYDGSARFYFRVALDSTPPSITYSGLIAGNCSIWPPNSEMIKVGTISASDADSGLASLNVTVSTMDSTGTSGDYSAVQNPDGSWAVNLRATRGGSGTGRVYQIAVQARDNAGNTNNATKNCTVPHDQGN